MARGFVRVVFVVGRALFAARTKWVDARGLSKGRAREIARRATGDWLKTNDAIGTGGGAQKRRPTDATGWARAWLQFEVCSL